MMWAKFTKRIWESSCLKKRLSNGHVGLTHLCSFKSRARFDRGENVKRIAWNYNRKQQSPNNIILQLQARKSPKTFCNLSSWVSEIARAGLAKARWVLQVAKLLNSCSQTLLPDPEAAASPDQRQICHYLPNICCKLASDVDSGAIPKYWLLYPSAMFATNRS